ncbi:hypothetical protein QLQ85_02460 [Halomonas sp. M4R5S39]|uniref:hypothetical protein n=1 Tax=Halomonas kalidii TaxID=3043293 RepID=UPI0024A9EDB9|nr:hypothetical protein [Halomonas kalidii]MDI5983637.1 hypothetical protein [Halomonas kalidii]
MPSPAERAAGTLALALVLWLGLGLVAGCSDDPELALGEERIAPDEAALERAMTARILEIGRRHEAAGEAIPRFNQPKTVACARATFEVPPHTGELARGLFAEPGEYAALLRFANATQQDDRVKDLRGLSVRLAGVEGAEGVDGTRGRQDFLFNSHPALFAGTPEDFQRFVSAVADDRLWWYFLNPLAPQPKSLWIALRARSRPDSPLAIGYYSTTPYRYGDDETSAVKYAVRPCDGEAANGDGADGDDPDYLRHAMAAQLAGGEACLTFMVQFQTDPEEMPIEDASVAWDEDASPFRPVARLRLPPQEIDAPDALARCESLVFNPWNTHPAHRPLGGINRMRRDLYQAAGELRTTHNATLSVDETP